MEVITKTKTVWICPHCKKEIDMPTGKETKGKSVRHIPRKRLSPAQVEYIKGEYNKGTPAPDIAKNINRKPSTVYNIICKLKKKGFVPFKF